MKKLPVDRAGRKRRSARGSGSLYKRGPTGKAYPPDHQAAYPFWLAYIVNGQSVRQALKDDTGKPITSRDTAEAERKRILAPYQTGNKVSTLKAIVARLGDAETAVALATDEANPPLKLSD